MDEMMKQCRKCRMIFSMDNFPLRSDTNKPRSICRACNAIKSRLWVKSHPENRKIITKRYRENHKEQTRIYKSHYRMINKEKINASDRRRYKLSPEKDQAKARNRRGRIAGGIITADEWASLLELYGGKCLCCESTDSITMDHIKPLSAGGMHVIPNVQPLCRSCNSKKRGSYLDLRFPYWEPSVYLKYL